MTGSPPSFINSIRQSGWLLTANGINKAQPPLGPDRSTREYTIEKIIQVAVLMSHTAQYLQPCVENLWTNPNIIFEAACEGLNAFTRSPKLEHKSPRPWLQEKID
jgi:hypothetical protein